MWLRERSSDKKKTNKNFGWVRGLPADYCHGHGSKPFPSQNVPPLLTRYNLADNGCWIWSGHKDKAGYGKEQSGGKVKRVHRYFYEAAKGKIPDGLVIDHLCRNRACVNPEHLEAVTDKVNVRRGQRTKLDAQSVLLIKKMVTGGMSQKAVAEKYNVKPATISHVITGRQWGDISAQTIADGPLQRG